MSAYPYRKPDEWEIQRAYDEVYFERLEDLMGEAVNEADEFRTRRIAMAVMKQDPMEVGQIVMDILEAYCKPDNEDAYLRAQQNIEFGGSE